MGPPPVPKYCAQEADIVSCVDLLVKNAVHVVTGVPRVLLQFHHYTQTLQSLECSCRGAAWAEALQTGRVQVFNALFNDALASLEHLDAAEIA